MGRTRFKPEALPILPDEELLELAEDVVQESRRGREDRSSVRQDVATRWMEAISRELKNRGITGPPWWQEKQ